MRAEGLTKQVSTSDHDLVIVSNATFQVGAGESVAIVGASGSGKSTLLGLLAGLDVPTAGRVWIDGEDLFALDEDGARRAARAPGRLRVPVVPAAALAHRAGERDAAAGTRGRARTPTAGRRGMLAQVGLADRLGHYPRQLSGGEQQRVALARAFAAEPKLLFADEPTGNLDSATGAQVIELLFG